MVLQTSLFRDSYLSNKSFPGDTRDFDIFGRELDPHCSPCYSRENVSARSPGALADPGSKIDRLVNALLRDSLSLSSGTLKQIDSDTSCESIALHHSVSASMLPLADAGILWIPIPAFERLCDPRGLIRKRVHQKRIDA